MSNHSRAPDREARFTALYEAAYADLIRFARRRADRSRAEDIVAEAFLVAWRRLDDVPRHPADARAWLFGITRHTLLNARRGADRQQAVAVRLAEAAPTPQHDGDAELVASQVDLAAAWNRLSAIHQEALALAVLEGLAAPQAAVVLGISPVAFRLRLSRARRALRFHLDHFPRTAPAEAGIGERNGS
ncbi:RNA polymerase, sigma-24 subunit, ECF subfamily [Kribbella flavida DSM 17836]|uniref:RNA polymerase, sigma-24 subunit, ECF subfamily n=1 Tax=Kribbella flavida (strain DSM 17836 / JCM 10339 / NBRC 14399) TaxID=479435 RepID=D2PZP4_KRIFD|nr:sigma-70 family RNA polymerase sigma factor [Kribbella flavida]ADB35610.1 RNA polymerase, sigma-24 subunit, ECF subfamily [Kribbella flavida DSM 17836]